MLFWEYSCRVSSCITSTMSTFRYNESLISLKWIERNEKSNQKNIYSHKNLQFKFEKFLTYISLTFSLHIHRKCTKTIYNFSSFDKILNNSRKYSYETNKNYFATDLYEILLYTRSDPSTFLAKIFFNNGRSDNIQITDPNSSIYIYTHISRPTDSFQRSIQPRRDSAWKFTLRSTADSVFSFGRADRRTARNSANLSAVDHRVSSKANTLPVASSMRVQACFSQITSMKRYNNLSLPRANHEFIFSRDPSNIWSVCRSMIFFFKDVAWWSVVNERGFTKNLVRKRGKVVREGYGRNMKTGWIVENWRDVVRAWSRFSNFFFFEIQFVLDPFENNLFKKLICNYDTDILFFFCDRDLICSSNDSRLN